MFINKEEIAKDVFIIKNKKGRFIADPNLKKNLYEKENIQVTLEYYGADVDYLSDDELYEKYNGLLPDNVDGSITLFFNLEDTYTLIKNEVKKLNKPKNKIDNSYNFEM